VHINEEQIGIYVHMYIYTPTWRVAICALTTVSAQEKSRRISAARSACLGWAALICRVHGKEKRLGGGCEHVNPGVNRG